MRFRAIRPVVVAITVVLLVVVNVAQSKIDLTGNWIVHGGDQLLALEHLRSR